MEASGRVRGSELFETLMMDEDVESLVNTDEGISILVAAWAVLRHADEGLSRDLKDAALKDMRYFGRIRLTQAFHVFTLLEALEAEIRRVKGELGGAMAATRLELPSYLR